MKLVRTVLETARKHLVTIPDAAPLVEAARLLSEREAGLLVVCGADGRMRGVITKSDVVRQISHCQGCSCTTMIADVMSKELVVCRPEDRLHDAWLLMKDHGLKQLPVSNDAAEPLGLLSVSDTLEALIKDSEYEESLLRDYVMGIGYR
ncbi:CBS domain-containing protein [Parapusillimonas granuli]|uniref:CBS domain-containing protein n=1 Tax=Parapusillimonas granuli TaxID=380911 RepID=A0A853G2N9_9BURK|nr:CBS domain-containing protein [Parapusillimonas granuli]MBB5214948.1 CBS domain-containing protein [Parapusillimonas granuli]MEB2401193.1 CBS domain-containing protein [Alcaligenaceae bacterium]NYT49270.1 CBS domain-containing protein [Parapusillimonas granuli]